MRYTSLAVAASLLAKDTVLAGTLHGHRVHRPVNQRDVTTEEFIETHTVYKTVTIDWDGTSSTSSAEPITTIGSTVTISITSVVKPSSSAAPTSSLVPVQQAQVVAAPSSSSTTAQAAIFKAVSSIVSPVVAVVPTTLATFVKPATTEAAAAATTTAATSSGNTSSSGKRGLPYNTASLLSAFAGGSSKYWAYNWASHSDGLASSFEFVPMLWGLGSSFTSGWSAAASSAIAAGSTALLGFNEPDLGEQANIGYVEAAAGYKTFMQPFAGKAKLGSPAVTNGAAPMGLTYLKNFISACDGCTIDFCAIHWYDSASNVDYFKNYMKDASTACGGKPIWITEFGAAGSAAEQATFLKTVIPWLDSQSFVERYAYFMASDGVLLSGTSLSAIGQAFASS